MTFYILGEPNYPKRNRSPKLIGFRYNRAFHCAAHSLRRFPCLVEEAYAHDDFGGTTTAVYSTDTGADQCACEECRKEAES